MRLRVEDLGVIREKLIKVLDESPALMRAESKHTVDRFLEHYSDPRNIEELHDQIKWLKNELWEIYEIAEGNDYES